MAVSGSREEIIKILDQEHQWPTWYLFKFIAPRGMEDQVVALFPEGKTSLKASSTGKYRSVTAKMMMSSAQEVLDIYEKAGHIEGVLAL
jgi:putative lipoic acid-binding regulatory protein